MRDAKGRFTDSAVRSRPVSRDAEAAIQRAFFAMVRLHGGDGIKAWSCPNEGARGKVQTARLVAQGLTAGAPDVIVLWRGGGALIEFKASRGAQSGEQRQFQRDVEALGWPYLLCRSWEDAWAHLVRLGAPVARVVASDRPLRLVPNPSI